MFTKVRIDLRDAFETETREQFWNAFFDSAGLEGRSRDLGEENQLRAKFPKILEEYLNHIYGPFSRFDKFSIQIFPRALRRIKIDLVDIQYGSADLLLNIIGVDDKMLAQGFWQVLEYYCPIAFNEVFGTSVPLHASAEWKMGTASANNPAKNKLNIVAASLLTPVILALAIIYVAFGAMNERVRAVDEERKSIREEHTKILSAIMLQNEKFASAALGRVSDSKLWDAFQQDTIKKILSMIPNSTGQMTKEPKSEP